MLRGFYCSIFCTKDPFSFPGENGEAEATGNGEPLNEVVLNGVVVGEADEYEYETKQIAPDGGYGWLVLLGSIIVNILIPGTVKSFGILFVEFIEVFDATPSAAAWIPALSYFLYSSTGTCIHKGHAGLRDHLCSTK